MTDTRQPVSPAPPAFDDTVPWGAWRPVGHVALLLWLTHRIPRWLSPLVRLLRRPVKYGVRHPLDVVIWRRRLRLMPRGNMSEQKLLFAPRSFDPEELAVLAERLRPGDCFVDVGANAGAYSLWADRCMEGKGRILAVEPDPEMRRRLAFNLATNGIRGVEICPVALSDHAGSAELHVNPAQRGQNTLEAEEARSAGGRREGLSVTVETLVDLLSRRGVAGIRALKIDVEGHEVPILRHFFANAPRSMWPETIIGEAKAATAEPLEALMHATGYRCLLATRLNLVYERHDGPDGRGQQHKPRRPQRSTED